MGNHNFHKEKDDEEGNNRIRLQARKSIASKYLVRLNHGAQTHTQHIDTPDAEDGYQSQQLIVAAQRTLQLNPPSIVRVVGERLSFRTQPQPVKPLLCGYRRRLFQVCNCATCLSFTRHSRRSGFAFCHNRKHLDLGIFIVHTPQTSTADSSRSRSETSAFSLSAPCLSLVHLLAHWLIMPPLGACNMQPLGFVAAPLPTGHPPLLDQPQPGHREKRVRRRDHRC